MNIAQIGDFIIKDSWAQQEKKRSRQNSANKNNRNQNDNSFEKNNRYAHDNSFEKNNRFLNDNSFDKQSSPSRLQIPRPNKNSNITKSQNKDEDLVLMMTQRLSQCEKQLENYRYMFNKEKNLKNQQLRIQDQKMKMNNQNHFLKENQRKYFQKINQSSIVQNLKDKNQFLEDKVKKMEAFLDQYGLKWQQGKSQRNDELAKGLNNDLKPSKFNNKLPSEIDINVIHMRIQELNMIMEKEKPIEIVKDRNNMNILKKLEPIIIGFYKNGLVIQGNPFSPYSATEAQNVLADLLEGYFPYQLKKKYPEGIPIKVLDRLREEWNPNKVCDMKTIESQEEARLKPQKLVFNQFQDDFFNDLPQSVIKDGKVIGIRDDLKKNLIGSGKTNKKEEVSPECDIVGNYEVPTQLKLKDDRDELTDQEIFEMVTLKIRTENAKRTLIVRLLSSNTMAQLYQIVDKYSETKSYEIACNFPQQSFFNDNNITLEQFHPSAALFLKKK